MNGVRVVLSVLDTAGNVRTVKRDLTVDDLRDDFKPPAAIVRAAAHALVDELLDQADTEAHVIAEAGR